MTEGRWLRHPVAHYMEVDIQSENDLLKDDYNGAEGGGQPVKLFHRSYHRAPTILHATVSNQPIPYTSCLPDIAFSLHCDLMSYRLTWPKYATCTVQAYCYDVLQDNL